MVSATITDPDGIGVGREPVRRWEGLSKGDLAANVLTGYSHRWLLYLTTLAGLAVLVLAIRADGHATPSSGSSASLP